MAIVGEQTLRLSTLLTNLNKGASVARMLFLLYSLVIFIQKYYLKILQKNHNESAISRKKYISPS